MKINSYAGLGLLTMVAFPSAATAASYTATASTFEAIFKKAVGGDTINLAGNFGLTRLSNKIASVPITINATRATFTDSLVITSVTGLKIIGGKYGSATKKTSYVPAISVGLSKSIVIDKASVVGFDGVGQGIAFRESSNVSVTNSSLSRLRAGVVFTSVTNGAIVNNKSVGASSDGFVVNDSHTVNVSRNSCSGGVPSPGAHPDCVQLWSLPGRPIQSDIDINFNTATGATQGFASFTPQWGGGLRITFRNNRVDTSFPQGIACYGCIDSTIINNVVTTLPGSKYVTRITVSGGKNVYQANNSVGPKLPAGPRSAQELAVMSSLDMQVGSSFTDATSIRSAGSADGSFGPAGNAVGAIPEPSTWAMMIIGFGLVGVAIRRRPRDTRDLAA